MIYEKKLALRCVLSWLNVQFSPHTNRMASWADSDERMKQWADEMLNKTLGCVYRRGLLSVGAWGVCHWGVRNRQQLPSLLDRDFLRISGSTDRDRSCLLSLWHSVLHFQLYCHVLESVHATMLKDCCPRHHTKYTSLAFSVKTHFQIQDWIQLFLNKSHI